MLQEHPIWLPKENSWEGECGLELLLGPDEVDGVLVDGRGLGVNSTDKI